MEATVAFVRGHPLFIQKLQDVPNLPKAAVWVTSTHAHTTVPVRYVAAPFQDTNTPTTAVNDARIYGTIVHSLKMLCTSSVALYAAIAMAIAIVGERSFHALESSSWT